MVCIGSKYPKLVNRDVDCTNGQNGNDDSVNSDIAQIDGNVSDIPSNVPSDDSSDNFSDETRFDTKDDSRTKCRLWPANKF